MKSMEVGPSFRISAPKFPTDDPNYRLIGRQRARYERRGPVKRARAWLVAGGNDIAFRVRTRIASCAARIRR